MPTVYHYDDQGVFVGSTEARKDPLESIKQGADVFLLPAYATFVSPPEGTLPENNKYRWTGSWEVVEDYRGAYAYQQTAPYQTMLVDSVGPLPSGYSLSLPVVPEQ